MKTLIAAAVLGVVAVSGAARAELVYGITTTNKIISFDSASPGSILSGFFISGLQSNEEIEAIDMRTNPAASAGVIYGVGSTGRVYTLNPSTGAATQVGLGNNLAGINGASFDMDFNPTVDRFRLVSDADQNLRYDPNTGLQSNIDGTLAYTTGTPNPNIAGIAYTNNFAGAATTTLYGIDAGNDTLNTISVPNSGTITAGPVLRDGTGVALDVSDLLGFDISGVTGTAFVAAQQGGNGFSQFSVLNLATGNLTGLLAGNNATGLIGGGLFVRDITVAIPEPATLSVAGLAVLGLASRRRRA